MIFLSPNIFSFIGIAFILSCGWPSYDRLFSLVHPHEHEWQLGTSSTNHPSLDLETFSTSAQQVSIPDLLTKSQAYHEQLVLVRGRITQPELHLDETELYVDFVFRLTQETQSIIVYGRHDRTIGAPPIIMDHSVEVTGIFWKEQDRAGTTVFNVLEASSVAPYPSSVPDST